MRILRDRRGATTLEFSMIALPFFFMMFGFFDIGRYAIVVNSEKILASAEARAIMVSCYGPAATAGTSPASCTTDPLTTTQKLAFAPWLANCALVSCVSITSGSNAITVTVSYPFTLMVPYLTSLNNPSVSTTIPF